MKKFRPVLQVVLVIFLLYQCAGSANGGFSSQFGNPSVYGRKVSAQEKSQMEQYGSFVAQKLTMFTVDLNLENRVLFLKGKPADFSSSIKEARGRSDVDALWRTIKGEFVQLSEVIMEYAPGYSIVMLDNDDPKDYLLWVKDGKIKRDNLYGKR